MPGRPRGIRYADHHNLGDRGVLADGRLDLEATRSPSRNCPAGRVVRSNASPYVIPRPRKTKAVRSG
ncbi:hypothetical protein [Nonomuraea angiospora]